MAKRKWRPSVQDRRAERELLFWTARQVLRLAVLIALTIHVVVAVARGELPGAVLLDRASQILALIP